TIVLSEKISRINGYCLSSNTLSCVTKKYTTDQIVDNWLSLIPPLFTRRIHNRKGEKTLFKYILRRVGYMAIAMFIIATATFFLMKTLPGSPLNDTADLTAEQEAMLEAQYGLDEPVAVQYVKYM